MSASSAAGNGSAASSLLYVGHATTLIDLDGVRLLTDPLLRNRPAHLRRTVPVDASAVHGLDGILISHGHQDHLDLPSLSGLDHSVPVVVPRGLGGLVRRRRFSRVVEVEDGDEIAIGSLSIRTNRVQHDGGRPPFAARAEALGYVISGSRRVYFAGDTALFPELEGLVPGLDLALVPIWGWGRTLGRGLHLDPETAAQAVRMLRPRIAVPIHWGTYRPFWVGVRRLPAFLTRPAEEFQRAVAAVAPDVEVRVLRPGERLSI